MIDPKKILALFDEPTKNQGLILHYAYQAMPDLATEVISLREIERAARELIEKIGQEHADCVPDPTIFPYEIKLRQALSSPHPGAELLERVKVLEAERDAVVNDTRGYCASCAFVDDCAKHDNNDAAPSVWYYGDCDDWQWHFIAQAKEARP